MTLRRTQWIFYFFMRSAPRPSCGSNGIQMAARGWPTGGRHRRLRPAGSVLKLVHHITVPHMPCLGPLSVSMCMCLGQRETETSIQWNTWCGENKKNSPYGSVFLIRTKGHTTAQKPNGVFVCVVFCCDLINLLFCFCKFVMDETQFLSLNNEHPPPPQKKNVTLLFTKLPGLDQG